MLKVKVSNYWDVPNQFVIWTDEGTYFQSYDSIIAFRPNDGSPIQLGPDWDYSRTTGKYRNKFLNESLAETREKLANDRYILNEDLAVGDKSKFLKLKKVKESIDSPEVSLDALIEELREAFKDVKGLWE